MRFGCTKSAPPRTNLSTGFHKGNINFIYRASFLSRVAHLLC